MLGLPASVEGTDVAARIHRVGFPRGGVCRRAGLQLARAHLDAARHPLSQTVRAPFPTRPRLAAVDRIHLQRFLVPHLCGYQGKAIFMDCDMLCLGDIKELDDLDMAPYALRVVKHDYRPTATTKMDGRAQTVYPSKNWSSLMLMNCARLQLWTKEVVESETGAYPASISGHRRRPDRRHPRHLEHARLDGRAHQADPLHERRTLVRGVPDHPYGADLARVARSL